LLHRIPSTPNVITLSTCTFLFSLLFSFRHSQLTAVCLCSPTSSSSSPAHATLSFHSRHFTPFYVTIRPHLRQIACSLLLHCLIITCPTRSTFHPCLPSASAQGMHLLSILIYNFALLAPFLNCSISLCFSLAAPLKRGREQELELPKKAQKILGATSISETKIFKTTAVVDHPKSSNQVHILLCNSNVQLLLGFLV
jgi:hypothetical protein